MRANLIAIESTPDIDAALTGDQLDNAVQKMRHADQYTPDGGRVTMPDCGTAGSESVGDGA